MRFGRAIGFLRKPGIILLFVCIWVAGCASGETPASAPEDIGQIVKKYPELRTSQAERDRVVRIVDGDTVELASGEKVRLIGVNTPEIHGQTQPYGKEASEFTRKELLGKDVVLFPDVSDRDRYGRLLRYVFVSGTDDMFNGKLLTEGYAQVMTIAPNVEFAEDFRRLEREARSRNAGLWGLEAGNDEKEDDRPEPSASASAEPAPCPNPIKGNINSKGDKIYHVPGGASYERTKPEMWFCTEQEAQEAGFRKAPR